MFRSTEAALGTDAQCAMVYNDESSTWAYWEEPWFTRTRIVDGQWAAWVRSSTGRRLIITQSIVPGDVPADWRRRGAGGEYDQHVRALGVALVRAGLGSSVIRLAPEGNFKPGVNSIGSNTSEIAEWRQYWARAAAVLHHVPGGHLSMDWTVNAGIRPLPFAAYYPGDQAVDVIGVDAYDGLVNGSNPPAGIVRWNEIANEPFGLNALVAFARSHKKPFSIPEWGIVKAGTRQGRGDDPTYIEQMAAVFRSSDMAYECYFGPPGELTLPLQELPRSLAAYRSEVLRQPRSSES